MNDELDILVSRYLDGTASAEEVDRLDGLMTRDRRVAGEVYRAAYLDALLRDAMVPSADAAPAGPDADRDAAAVAEPIRLPVAASTSQPRTAEPTGPTRLIHPARFRRTWAWAAAACLVVGAFVGWRLMRPAAIPTPPQIVYAPAIPKVAAAGGASIHGPAGDRPAASHASLKLNDELRTAAAPASIAYDSEATRITIAPRSGVALLDAGGKRFKLTGGRVDCEVEKQKDGRRLVIVTDQAEMTVVGTKFNVTTVRGWTRLQVSEGTVRVRRHGDGATVDVSGGEYVEVAAPGAAAGPAQGSPWAGGAAVGKDMGAYWSPNVRPAGISQ